MSSARARRAVSWFGGCTQKLCGNISAPRKGSALGYEGSGPYELPRKWKRRLNTASSARLPAPFQLSLRTSLASLRLASSNASAGLYATTLSTAVKSDLLASKHTLETRAGQNTRTHCGKCCNGRVVPGDWTPRLERADTAALRSLRQTPSVRWPLLHTPLLAAAV